MSLTLSPLGFKRRVSVAVDRASTNNKRVAGYKEISDWIGTGFVVRLLKNDVTQATFTAASTQAIPYTASGIVLTAGTFISVSQPTTLDLSTGTWTCEIASTAMPGYKVSGTLGTSGTDFLLGSASVGPGLLSMGTITILFPGPIESGDVIWTGDVTVPAEFLGMHVYGLPTAAPYRTAPSAPTFPVGFIRSWNYGDAAPSNNGIAWTNIEQAAGVYTWTNMDAWRDYWYTARGAKLMYTFGWWQPTFYSGSNSILHKGVPQLTPLKNFVKAMCLRYQNQLSVIETWNEPNYTGDEGWSGTVTELLSVQKAIWDGVQEAKAALLPGVTLNTKVCMPAFVDRDPDWGLIRQYVQASYGGVQAKDITDAFSFHLYEFGDGYTSGLEDPWQSGYDILKMRTVLRDYGGFSNWATIPFYDSEHGFYRNAFQTGTDNAGRATIIKRTAVVQAVLKTASIFWYAGDDFGSTNVPAGNPVPGFPLQTDSTVGLIGSPLYQPTIAAAFQWIATNISGKRITRVNRNASTGALTVTYYDNTSVTV